MITVNRLYHDYTGKGTYAVNDVSFTVAKGEIFGFLGPSGAGKSTVQNIMTGLLPLQQGEVRYQGTPIQSMKADFFNEIGVSFEHPNLYTKLTGHENLRYFAGMFDVPTADPLQLLEMVDLRESAHKKANAYSKGMKQRLVFARALLNNPKYLFLDEPTSGLDPSTASRIKNIILKKKADGCTVFLTTHNMVIAEELCDRVAFINDGRIVAMDSPRNLKLQFGERSVNVEYVENGETVRKSFSLNSPEERTQLSATLENRDIQTVHTQEASLEQIFIKLTGRGLS